MSSASIHSNQIHNFLFMTAFRRTLLTLTIFAAATMPAAAHPGHSDVLAPADSPLHWLLAWPHSAVLCGAVVLILVARRMLSKRPEGLPARKSKSRRD